MAIDRDRFSAANLAEMARVAHVIVEVGANPYGSGVTFWCKIMRHVHRDEYETTYAEDSGSLDSAWSGAWAKFVDEQQRRACDGIAAEASARQTLDALGAS